MLDREKDGIYTTKIGSTTIGALTRKQQRDAVDCPVCLAKRGNACIGKNMRNGASHPERRKLAMKMYGILPPQAVLPNNRVDGWYKKFREHIKDEEEKPKHRRPRKASRPRGKFLTRFECPICGGPHPRAEHMGLREIVERRRQERVS